MMISEVTADLTTPPPGLMPAPLSVEIAITGHCNLDCEYCYYAQEGLGRKDLPTERWLDFFEELGGLAVQRVVLTGGEPFARSDLFQLVDGITKNRMRYSILTNGTLINKEALAQFRIGKRRLRLDSIQVSIDGSRAEIHNKSRPDSFNRALNGLRMLVENGFPVTARVTINKHNIHDLKDIALLLLEDVGLASFSTDEAIPLGAASCSGKDVTLTREQRGKAMYELISLSDHYDGRISASSGPLALARHFAEIESRMVAGEKEIPGRGFLSACGMVFHRVCTLHDGTIVPCLKLPMLSMGTIGKKDVGDIWLHHPAINALRHRRSMHLRSLETCSECPYTGFCTGGCPALVMNKTGQLNVPNPLSCYKSYLDKDPYDRWHL